MSLVKKAIEEITYTSKIFPEKAFQVITANREEAIPYLRAAVDKAVLEREELDNRYQLHFYAIFLLGEFQDRESFPQIMKLVSLPKDTLEYLIGDAVTSGFPDIAYNTYNGDLELLKDSIQNKEIDEFIRAGLLQVMGQLYLDGTLAKQEWTDFIRQNIHSGREYEYLYNELAYAICRCHFVDMLPEIRYLFDSNLMDEGVLGKYDSCVDIMFEYHDRKQNFCKTPISAVKLLSGWCMFQDETDRFDQKKTQDALMRLMREEQAEKGKKIKIQRNDPCPCGSGKKYKYCCLNKPKEPIDMIEDVRERRKWLERYPEEIKERQAGRVYLEDYYDLESIEIDKLLYLGLMHRPRLIWLKETEEEKNRKRAYLELAFTKFTEKVEKERIGSIEKYDEKYSIHYNCDEWFPVLKELLRESGKEDVYSEVLLCEKRMKAEKA